MERRSVFATAVLLTLCMAKSGMGANRFYILDQSVVAGSTGIQVPVRCDNDETLYGFSLGLGYDEQKLRVTDVTKIGTAASSADFFSGRVDGVNGLLGYGCVFDLEGTFDVQKLPAGTDQVIAFLVIDVLSTVDETASLTFQDVTVGANNFLVKNLMTTTTGASLSPALSHGTLTIETRKPQITLITGNSGLEGTVFQVAGEYFTEPGLEVSVCGAPAAASLQPDGQTLDVTAPGCGEVGCVEVEVCTARGCTSNPAGFCYEAIPAPVIGGFQDNMGREGRRFLIQGRNFGHPSLTIRVCDLEAEYEPPTDGGTSVAVLAPACASNGLVPVEVCTRYGCASVADGFLYGPLFIRGDCNGDGHSLGSVSDVVFLLEFAFREGPRPPCIAACDANGDGSPGGDVSDAVFLLLATFMGTVEPPSPFPACGPGSGTDLLLGCSLSPEPCR